LTTPPRIRCAGAGHARTFSRLAVAALAAGSLAATAALSGCAVSPGSVGGGSPGSHRLQVVAAENFWGSIAAQVGGSKADVTSIITNPATDPHSYEPTPADARAVALAPVVIVNGVGYDAWANRLLDASPLPGRIVLNVGDLVGARTGDNPHRWYDPSEVEQVTQQIATDYGRADPADAAYFRQQAQDFLTTGLAGYHALITQIRARYAGVKVGASESIFAMLAPALGLDLVTPSSFLRAITEGTDPTAADKATIDRQISSGEIKVYVYNSQNATPDIQQQIAAARARGIPVTTITETLSPAGATFQQWQTDQLRALAAALATATGH
jgi:zinc/manganese transport system substrate-binding protein